MRAWNRIHLNSLRLSGRRNLSPLIALLALLLLALSVSQAPAALSNPWWTVDAGGGGSCYQGSAGLSLCGSLGQPDASPALLTGGTFSLQSGFWSGPRHVRYVIYLPLASN